MRFLYYWIWCQLLSNFHTKQAITKNTTICEFYYSTLLLSYQHRLSNWLGHFCNEESDQSTPVDEELSTPFEGNLSQEGVIVSPEFENCSEVTETVNGHTITWPITNSGDAAISSPLCLDDKFKVMYRQCIYDASNGTEWEPLPQCTTTQQLITNPCSSDLTYTLDRFCYKIVKNTSFPPLCPYNETLPWSEHFAENYANGPIWMPVQRQNHSIYGFDLMRYVEPTENYKLPFKLCTDTCRILFYSGTLTDKNCQVYHNSTHIELVRCDAKYSAICLYDALPLKPISYCSKYNSNCVQSEYDTKSKCFCLGYKPSGALVEILYPYQNFLYRNLTQFCHIGLIYQKDNISVPFIWNNTAQPLTYTNWIETEQINYDNQYSIITPNGWSLTNEKPTVEGDCSLYELIPSWIRASLHLEFNDALQLFELTINSSYTLAFDRKLRPLAFCFTDADSKSLIYRIDFSESIDSNGSYVFRFSPLAADSGPGSYWCEAFFHPNLTMKISNMVFYRNQTNQADYVVNVKLLNYQEQLSAYPLTRENLEMLQNLLKNELPRNSSFYPRIVKINGIDDQVKEMMLTFHLSSSKSQNSSEEFIELTNALKHLKTFQLIYFRAADFCPENITMKPFNQPVIWPITKLDNETYPSNGFCVTNDSIIVKRKCNGTFIDGAFWEDVDYCIFYSSSDLTKPLLSIVEAPNQDDPSRNIDDVLSYTKDYKKLFPLDILLVADFIRNVSNQKPDVQNIADIINNLMKAPKPSLSSAQDNFKATDHILQTLDTILIDSDYGEWKTSNFVIKSVNIKNDNFYGILLQNCNTNLTSCTITTITNKTFIKSDITNDTFAGIYLSADLQRQIVNYSGVNSTYVPKIIVSIHYGSELFVDDGALKFSKFVFGVLLPEFDQPFEGPLLVYYSTKANNSISFDFNCSYWKFRDENESFWQVEDMDDDSCMDDDQQAVVCSFYHVTNFGVTYSLKNQTSNVKKSPTTSKFHTDSDKVCSFSLPNTTPFDSEICPSNQTNTLLRRRLHSIHLQQSKNVLQMLYNLEQFFLSSNVKILDLANIQAFIHILQRGSSKINGQNLLKMFLKTVTLITEDLAGKRTAVEIIPEILRLIDDIMLNFHETFHLHTDHVVILLISGADTVSFSGFSLSRKNKISLNPDEKATQSDEILLTVSLDSHLQQQIAKTKSRIIFIVFKDNIFFPPRINMAHEMKMVTEILFPELDDALLGSILISYPNQVTTDNHFCSYWDSHSLSETFNEKWQSELRAESNETNMAAICKFNHVTYFALITTSHNITDELENLLYSNLTGNEKLTQVQKITNRTSNDLIAIDISLISRIILSTLTEGTFTSITSAIISDLHDVTRDVLKESQLQYQATDLLLFTMDEMAAGDNEENILNRKNFAVVIRDFQTTNFSGLVIYGCQIDRCKIDELKGNLDPNNDFSMEFPEPVAAILFFNESLIDQVSNLNNSKVIVTIYFRDDFFNEIDNITEHQTTTTTMIFGVIFPGLDQQLDGTISLMFTNVSKTTANQCSHWNYNVTEHQAGFWDNDNLPITKSQELVCEFTHATHFAMLIDDSDDYNDDIVLDLITDIECILSLIGITLILITALLFKKWRQNIGNVILLNFSVAISLKIILLYSSAYVKTNAGNKIACTIIGSILHYSILSECAWMLTIAILQFKRFVEVLGGPLKYVLIKALVCGWVFPLIPVICVLITDEESYQEGYQNGLCYPSHLALYLGIWLPVLLIVSINLIIFIFILYNICHRKTECIDMANHEILFQWRLALLLFFMLGLTWLLGFLGQIKSNRLFTYLFCITASLQGFVMFLFFILFNKNTRRLYAQAVKKWFINRGIFNLRKF